jgi:hypothetical protein
MNYRSAVVVGTARRVRDPKACADALECIVNHVIPGRGSESRPPTAAEMKQTAVLEVPIDQASAKMRTGGPVEEPDDLELEIWAGVIRVTTTFGAPETDEQGRDVPVPPSVTSYSRP